MPKKKLKAQNSNVKTDENWQRLTSKTVYKNPFFQVREDLFLRKNRTKGKYFTVNLLPFVEVLPLTEDKKVFLVGQYRPAVEAYSWEIPAGGVRKGELPEEAAQRELAEETGLKAEKLMEIGQLWAANGHSNALGIYFLAQNLKKVKKLPSEEGEILKVKKVSLKSLKEMIFNGKIKDGPTANALFLLENYLKTHGG